MAETPNSIVTPQHIKSGAAACTTANTTYTTAPTNTQVLITAGPNGARYTKVTAIPLETVADTQLQLFRDLDGTGTKRFFNSAKMPSYTMATGTAATPTDFGYSEDNPLTLAPNEKVYSAVAISKAITFVAEGADF